MLISQLPFPGVPGSLVRNGGPASARARPGQARAASSRQTVTARSALFGRCSVIVGLLSARGLYAAAAMEWHSRGDETGASRHRAVCHDVGPRAAAAAYEGTGM